MALPRFIAFSRDASGSLCVYDIIEPSEAKWCGNFFRRYLKLYLSGDIDRLMVQSQSVPMFNSVNDPRNRVILDRN